MDKSDIILERIARSIDKTVAVITAPVRAAKAIVNPTPDNIHLVIKGLHGICGVGFVAGLLLGSGVDYPPAPDGISWWNVWLGIASFGIAIISLKRARKLEKKRFRIVKTIRRKEPDAA